MEQKTITVLEVMGTSHLADEEKDSSIAFWQVVVKCLEGITKNAKEKTIVVKEATPTFIKKGIYKLIGEFKNIPLYEIKSAA